MAKKDIKSSLQQKQSNISEIPIKILALDFGLSKIGVALLNTENNIAFPRKTLRNDADIFEKLKNLCKKENIAKIIIGKALMLDGKNSEISDFTERFIEKLKKKLSLEIITVNEQFTSKIAQQKMQELTLKKTKKKLEIDSIAAQILLEEYISKI